MANISGYGLPFMAWYGLPASRNSWGFLLSVFDFVFFFFLKMVLFLNCHDTINRTIEPKIKKIASYPGNCRAFMLALRTKSACEQLISDEPFTCWLVWR